MIIMVGLWNWCSRMIVITPIIIAEGLPQWSSFVRIEEALASGAWRIEAFRTTRSSQDARGSHPRVRGSSLSAVVGVVPARRAVYLTRLRGVAFFGDPPEAIRHEESGVRTHSIRHGHCVGNCGLEQMHNGGVGTGLRRDWTRTGNGMTHRA